MLSFFLILAEEVALGLVFANPLSARDHYEVGRQCMRYVK